MRKTQLQWKREAVRRLQDRGLTRKQAIIYVEIHGYFHGIEWAETKVLL